MLVENGFAHQPIYVQRFFRRELGFAETAIVFNLHDLRLRKEKVMRGRSQESGEYSPRIDWRREHWDPTFSARREAGGWMRMKVCTLKG